MNGLNNFLPLIQTICGAVIGIAGYFMAVKTGIIQIKNETILSMQQQIDTLKAKQETLQKDQEALQQDKAHLKAVVKSINGAFQCMGILVTVENDMVTIEDNRHQIRRLVETPPSGKSSIGDLNEPEYSGDWTQLYAQS